MNPQIVGVILATLGAIGFISQLYAKLHAERAKRIEAIQQLMEARAERDEWQVTARENLRAFVGTCATVAANGVQIDSLMNGDRRCVEGHRYFTGQGISCPWCSADEVPAEKCPQCGKPVHGEYPTYCTECSMANYEIPF